MFIRAIKFLAIAAIITGAVYAFGSVGADDFATFNGGAVALRDTLQGVGIGAAIAGAGVITMFCAKWYEYEQTQKKKRNGRR